MSKQIKSKYISDCCGAEILPQCADEGTCHAHCSKCGEDCNFKPVETQPEEEIEDNEIMCMNGTFDKKNKPELEKKVVKGAEKTLKEFGGVFKRLKEFDEKPEKSQCCNADMLDSGQCVNCGADGKVKPEKENWEDIKLRNEVRQVLWDIKLLFPRVNHETDEMDAEDEYDTQMIDKMTDFIRLKKIEWEKVERERQWQLLLFTNER